MVSQRMLQLGTARSVIRELFEYGRQPVSYTHLTLPTNSLV